VVVVVVVVVVANNRQETRTDQIKQQERYLGRTQFSEFKL
jgi:hypothetical protein